MAGPDGRRGVFITLEGGEGGGKSTQAKLLADALRKRGYDVVLTREPGGAPGAEAIRELLVKGDPGRWDGLTEAMLHYAARRNHLVNTVRPAMDAGKVVISDRFADSTLAYQGYGHGIDRTAIAALHQAAVGDFAPDLTLILDLPPQAGLKRAGSRGGAEDRYERMDAAFHERLRGGFLDIAKADPKRCKVIDAARDIDAIHRDILATVDAVLPEKA